MIVNARIKDIILMAQKEGHLNEKELYRHFITGDKHGTVFLFFFSFFFLHHKQNQLDGIKGHKKQACICTAVMDRLASDLFRTITISRAGDPSPLMMTDGLDSQLFSVPHQRPQARCKA